MDESPIRRTHNNILKKIPAPENSNRIEKISKRINWKSRVNQGGIMESNEKRMSIKREKKMNTAINKFSTQIHYDSLLLSSIFFCSYIRYIDPGLKSSNKNSVLIPLSFVLLSKLYPISKYLIVEYFTPTSI